MILSSELCSGRHIRYLPSYMRLSVHYWGLICNVNFLGCDISEVYALCPCD
jgi:hypothetical protein